MEILKTRDIGFCFGVRRAIKKAEQAIANLPANDIYMLGEIIHNPQVIKNFKKKGINLVQEITEVPPHKYLISRAHGIAKSESKYAKSHDIRLIDTTCPYVKRLQKLAILLKREKYQIIVFGDINHPEIKSLLSYIDNKALVVSSLGHLKNNKEGQISKKVGLLSQTTKDIGQFNKIGKEILVHAEELRIYNTICKATTLRQQATQELAKKVDLMVVIGGLNSANTCRLAFLSAKTGIDTYHIQEEKELANKWFKNKKKIGITSGTSTPDEVTDKVILEIKRIAENIEDSSDNKLKKAGVKFIK